MEGPSINEAQVRGLIYVWNTLEGETLFSAVLTIIIHFYMGLLSTQVRDAAKGSGDQTLPLDSKGA